jgi:hypothetical protein
MSAIIQTTVYQLSELSERAKDAARAWYREGAFDHDWHDAVYDDFEQICAILGIALVTRSVRLMGGGSRQKPCIWFSGFWSQGDGACFEGRYIYARGASVSIRAYAPKDTELHRIAGALQAAQKRSFYQLTASIRHRGRYVHEQSMDISVERSTGQEIAGDTEEAIADAVRDLARWLYRQLEREYDDLTSDASVDEAIEINAYTFTEQGRRFG